MRAKNQITGKENRLVRRLDQLPSLAWLKPLYAATGQGIFSGPEVLSAAHMRHIEPFFPRPGGLARVDDRRVISRIIMSLTDGFSVRLRRPATGCTRHFTTGSSAGAGSACIPASLPLGLVKAACPSGWLSTAPTSRLPARPNLMQKGALFVSIELRAR